MRGVVLWLLAVWVLFRVVALSVGCLELLEVVVYCGFVCGFVVVRLCFS